MSQALMYRRPPMAARGASIQNRPHHRFMILGFLIVLCCPITIAFYAGPLLITPYRIFMIVLFPYFFLTLFSDKSLKVGMADFCVLLFAVWSAFCTVKNIGDGVQRSGQYFLETVCAYLLARVTVRSIADVIYFLKLMFGFSVVAFALAVPEAITHNKFIMDSTSALTGIPYGQYAPGTDIRLGMRRPQAFFSNTILYGIFCASCISLFWYTTKATASRLFKTVVLTVATFFSLSSAPLLEMNVQFIMILGEYFTRGIKGRVPITLILTGMVTVVTNIGTNSGVVGFIINHLTFNSASAYNRILIWNWGVFNIKQHPIFGLDVDNWVRPYFMKPSCDNYWIVITMIGGIPALTFMLTAMGIIMWRFGKIDVKRLPPIYTNFRIGWFFSYIAFAFTGFSVMFFGGIQPLYFFLLGLAAAAVPIYQRAVRTELMDRRQQYALS